MFDLFFLQVVGAIQSFPKWPIFSQLKLLLSNATFLFTCPLDSIASSAITPVACLLINFASAEARICCILFIVLLPHSNMVVVVDSKSLCKESRATTITILSHISRFDIIATCSRFIKNRISAKVLMTNLSKPFDMLIYGYLRSSWRMEYTTPWPSCKQADYSLFHISFESIILMILL